MINLKKIFNFIVLPANIFFFIAQSNQEQTTSMFKNISKMFKNDAAIVVTGYNRIDYLNNVIKSLEANYESKYLPFFFIIDGGIDSKQEEIKELITKSKIKYKYLILREKNYGCGRTLIYGRKFLFDVCNFKKGILLEDDLIVSPNFITLTLNLYNWAKKKYSNIGFVQCWYRCKLNRSDKYKFLNKVHEPIREEFTENFWGHCTDKETWDKIKKLVYEYEKLFLDPIENYLNRDHVAIRSWIQKKYNENKHKLKIKNKLKSKLDNSIFLKDFYPTSQDGIVLFSLYMNNLIHVSTMVNRGIYIGKEGVHYNPNLWHSFGHSKVKPDWFEEDKNITEFEFVN